MLAELTQRNRTFCIALLIEHTGRQDEESSPTDGATLCRKGIDIESIGSEDARHTVTSRSETQIFPWEHSALPLRHSHSPSRFAFTNR